VFRHPLRGIFLLLSAAALAAAGPAAAVVDVEEVTLTVTVATTTIGQDQITVELRVSGTDLNNGTITLPSAPSTPVALDVDGADLVVVDDVASLAELNALWSNGNYVLRINNNTAQATIPYARPAVPNPAISQPDSGVIPPGPIEVLFEPCGSICSGLGESVEAVLEDDMAVVLDEDILTSNTDSWTPDDDMGGALDLPEASAFVVRVTHTAVDQDDVAVAGDDDDGNLVFTGTFVQSDEVDFETGFNPPSGRFCLAANHPAPPAGCTTLADPALQLFDLTGLAVATQVDGHDVDYTLSHDAGGNLGGSATADLDDNGPNETGPAPIKGKLKGGDGEASSKLSFSLENAGFLAKLKVSVSDTLSIPGNQLDRVQRASGAINGVKIKEEASATLALPMPLGWLLEYDLAADGTVTNAVLTLEGGRSFPLSGANKFNLASNESSLKLSSDPKGLSISLKGLGLDDSANPDPMAITGGDLSYKALGQSGRATLP
jgi:hypothetical protein